MSLSVEALHAESEAPKSDETVSPVVEALPKVVCPVTANVPPTTVLPDTVRAVAEALVSVVLPVTSSVEESIAVLPTNAP
jgi:hypothetical protein